MREYFKEEPKKSKFRTFCKNNGADYMEQGYAVWIKQKKSKAVGSGYCNVRSAIKLLEDGRVLFGQMQESCLNFREDTNHKVPETQRWMIEVLTKIQKYHR